eukprot:m.19603 g.19603  ORF g.19603 m.19603 type:complete len:276 (+) comp5968_c0_seq1:191-1018(+)
MARGMSFIVAPKDAGDDADAPGIALFVGNAASAAVPLGELQRNGICAVVSVGGGQPHGGAASLPRINVSITDQNDQSMTPFFRPVAEFVCAVTSARDTDSVGDGDGDGRATADRDATSTVAAATTATWDPFAAAGDCQSVLDRLARAQKRGTSGRDAKKKNPKGRKNKAGDGVAPQSHFDGSSKGFVTLPSGTMPMGSVLVHCRGGFSRSTTMAIALLMLCDRLTLSKAYAAVKSSHKRTAPRPLFAENLIALDKHLHGTASMTLAPDGKLAPSK